MGNDLGRGATGIGKDTRSAKSFTPPLPAGTAALSAAMEEAIVRALNQDISFSAENQAAFREDRPFVRDLLDEDRTMRNAAFEAESQNSVEDRETMRRLLELGLSAFGEDRARLEQDRATRDAFISQITGALDASQRPTVPALEAPRDVSLPGAPTLPAYTPPQFQAPGAPNLPGAPTLPTPGQGPAVERIPALDTFIAQMDEALKTGGVGAQIPLISRATEASRQATSNALSQLDEQLAASGLGRSSYGMRNRGDILLRGEQATADVGPRIAQEFINLGAQVLPGVEAGRSTAQRGAFESSTQRFLAEADTVLKRYGLDLDAVLKQYGIDVNAAVQRFGVETTAESQRFNALVDSAIRQYGIDVNAEINRYGTDVDAATKRYGVDVGRYGTELTALGSQESDLIRALVALTSGVSIPGTPQFGGAQAPSPQQLLGFGINAASPSQFLGLGPTGASLVQSGTSRANTGASVAAQRDIAEWQAIAQIYSSAISAAGCWIAFALYGPGCKWALARYYLFVVWQGQTAELTRRMYLKFGRRIARHPVFCRVLKPLFDIAVKRGEQAWAS